MKEAQNARGVHKDEQRRLRTISRLADKILCYASVAMEQLNGGNLVAAQIYELTVKMAIKPRRGIAAPLRIFAARRAVG